MRPGHSVPMLLLLAALAAPAVGAVGAASFPMPPPGQFVSDTAGLISKDDVTEIRRIAAALLAENRLPLTVVTIRSLAQGAAGQTIERYATELLQSQDEHTRAYGMLLIVAAENRAARIHLGSAWGNAHDQRARRVMDRLILPAFAKGEFSAGIVNGVRGLDAMGRERALPAFGQPSWFPSALVVEGLDGPWWMLPVFVVVGLVVLVGVRSVTKQGRRSWAWVAGAFVLGLVWSRIFGGSGEASEPEGGATGTWGSATDER